MDSRPRLVCIPSDDATFDEQANALLERLSHHAPRLTAARFADQIRLSYPTAIVRERDPLAVTGPGEGPVWYVIRRAFASRIAASVDIPVDRRRVFKTYIERMPEWQVVVRLKPLNRRPNVVGADYAASYEFMGRTLRGRLRVVDASAPIAVRVEAEGMGVKVWYVTTFRQTPQGTRVEVAGDYELPSRIIPKAMGKLVVERRISRDIERAHVALRDLCLIEETSFVDDGGPRVALASAPL